MTSPDPTILAAAIKRATDDLRPLLGIDDPEVNKAREQTEAMIVAAKAYQPMREALEKAEHTLLIASRILTEDHKMVLHGKRWGDATLVKLRAAIEKATITGDAS